MFKKLIFFTILSACVYADNIFVDPVFSPPTWQTVNRPTCPAAASACFGYNLDLNVYEYWNGLTWVTIGSVSITQWQPNTEYIAGQVIINNRDFYLVANTYTSSTDFYNDYNNLTALRFLSQEGWSTSALQGGVCTINPDGHSVDITSGFMNFADYWTHSPLREITARAFIAQTIDVAAFTTSGVTIYLNALGVIGATNNYTTDMEVENASLCRAVTDDSGNILLIGGFRWIPGNTDNKILETLSAMGMISRGLNIQGVAGTLTLVRLAGQITYPGIGYATPKRPNTTDVPAQSPLNFYQITGTNIATIATTLVNTTSYNPGGGAIISGMTVGKWGVSRQYIAPSGLHFIAYPQFEYNTMAEAVDGMNYEAYIENPLVKDGQLKAYSVFQTGATDTAIEATFRTITCPQFGCGTGGSGGTSGVSGGDVLGPLTSTDMAIPRFVGTTGKILQNSDVTLTSASVMDWPNSIGSKLILWGDPGAANFGIGISGSQQNYWTTTASSHNFYIGGENDTGTKEMSIANNGVTITDALTINNNGTNSVAFPTGRGTSGQVLTTNGTGGTSWATSSTGSIGGASNGSLAVTAGVQYTIIEGLGWPSATNCSIYIRNGNSYQVVTVNELFQNCNNLGCASYSIIANMIIGTKLMNSLQTTSSPGYNMSFTSAITGTVSIGRTCVRIDTGTGISSTIGSISTGTNYGGVGL